MLVDELNLAHNLTRVNTHSPPPALLASSWRFDDSILRFDSLRLGVLVVLRVGMATARGKGKRELRPMLTLEPHKRDPKAGWPDVLPSVGQSVTSAEAQGCARLLLTLRPLRRL